MTINKMVSNRIDQLSTGIFTPDECKEIISTDIQILMELNHLKYYVVDEYHRFPPHHKNNVVFIHGLQSSSSGFKAKLLKKKIPDIIIPDLKYTLYSRFFELHHRLMYNTDITLIGDSIGGLLAYLYAFYTSPHNVIKRLILLAPALSFLEYASFPIAKLKIPVVIIHGLYDNIIPSDIIEGMVSKLSEQVVILNLVEDDHFLHKTLEDIDFESLIKV